MGRVALAIFAVVSIICAAIHLQVFFKGAIIVKINSKDLNARELEDICWETIHLSDIICTKGFKKSKWSTITDIIITTKDYESSKLDVSLMSSEDKQTLLKLINDLTGQKRKLM
ncbi:hypothetical protein FACS1894122_14210 [Alphaproteobacteria bacterium]|nr:hypothetical protein FACS1894122_14210 [Alphaproteobacteria bacterium]